MRGGKIALVMGLALSVSGCATAGGARDFTCANKAKIIAAAQATIQAVDRLCPFDLNELVTEAETDE